MADYFKRVKEQQETEQSEDLFTETDKLKKSLRKAIQNKVDK